MKPWKRVKPTKVTKVGWRTITSKTFVMPDGSKSIFDTYGPENQQTAAIIALTDDNRVVIARSFRSGPERVLDELPGGFVEKGDTPEQTVLKELFEETGYAPTSVTPVGMSFIDAYSNATAYGFLARGCKKVADQTFERDEHIEIDTISIEKLITNAKAGQMTDATVVLMAYDEIIKIQEKI